MVANLIQVTSKEMKMVTFAGCNDTICTKFARIVCCEPQHSVGDAREDVDILSCHWFWEQQRHELPGCSHLILLWKQYPQLPHLHDSNFHFKVSSCSVWALCSAAQCVAAQLASGSPGFFQWQWANHDWRHLRSLLNSRVKWTRESMNPFSRSGAACISWISLCSMCTRWCSTVRAMSISSWRQWPAWSAISGGSKTSATTMCVRSLWVLAGPLWNELSTGLQNEIKSSCSSWRIMQPVPLQCSGGCSSSASKQLPRRLDLLWKSCNGKRSWWTSKKDDWRILSSIWQSCVQCPELLSKMRTRMLCTRQGECNWKMQVFLDNRGAVRAGHDERIAGRGHSLPHTSDSQDICGAGYQHRHTHEQIQRSKPRVPCLSAIHIVQNVWSKLQWSAVGADPMAGSYKVYCLHQTNQREPLKFCHRDPSQWHSWPDRGWVSIMKKLLKKLVSCEEGLQRQLWLLGGVRRRVGINFPKHCHCGKWLFHAEVWEEWLPWLTHRFQPLRNTSLLTVLWCDQFDKIKCDRICRNYIHCFWVILGSFSSLLWGKKGGAQNNPKSKFQGTEIRLF